MASPEAARAVEERALQVRALRPSFLGVLAFCVLLPGSGVAGAESSNPQGTHKRVLILHSYGRDIGPTGGVASAFQTELYRLHPGPVEFFEASLETARFSEAEIEEPLLDYLQALFAAQPMDLLVAIGGPAARFCLRSRHRLFPKTPLLAAGVERRWVEDIPLTAQVVAVPVVIDLPAAIDDILRLLPRTREVVVVLGASPHGWLWRSETEHELLRFSDRVRFTWTNEWSFQEMQTRLAALPPDSAILFGELSVDGDGLPHQQSRVVAILSAVANAPLFGLFDRQLGQGIVGGRLVSVGEAGQRAAAAAARVLGGEAAESIRVPPVTASQLTFDFRELQRWNIHPGRLPAGSQISFQPASAWKEYQGPVLAGLAIMGLQTALIAGLFMQRTRRLSAEGEARSFARRLLTAHEDERRRLARELHDDLSQRLARLSIDAARLERSLSGSPQEPPAGTIRSDLLRMAEDVHAISYQLHPSVLDDLGLKEALRVECDRFNRRESIHAELVRFETPMELPPDVSTCLFRIAQEALRNVARHSGASEVSLTVMPVNGGVQLLVRDDGVGFDPAEQRMRRSLGQASMRERANLVDGKLELSSGPGQGTTVRVFVPLRRGSP